MLLYINGQLADLDAGQVIAQTRQVNDLNSLDNRQAGYTNKFRLPKTANNIRIMDFLTLTGNHSNIPYQKNECSLYGDSGECFVYKGWAVITDGGEDYEAVVYDGIIDLYKAIENKSLAEIDLTGADHTKDLETVIGSWTNDDLNYRYIVADYNGKKISNSIVNYDYLIPSIRVSWLWQKLFELAEFDYKGNIFNSSDFKNLWITFPKGIGGGDDEIIFASNSYKFSGLGPSDNRYAKRYYASYNSADTDNGLNVAKTHLKVADTGYYKIKISGKIWTQKVTYNNYNDEIDRRNAPFRIILGKNSTDKQSYAVLPEKTLLTNHQSNTDFATTTFLSLSTADSVCIVIAPETDENKTELIVRGGSFQVTITKIEQGKFDFTEAFTDFSMRDFLNEVVHRFGLTMYKDPDKTKNSYTFLILKELIEESGIIDYSRKFSKKVSENYIYGNYAQLNWMRYNYNQKDDSYFDGCLEVGNKNLADSRDILKSKLYSPEKDMVITGTQKTHVYKLWEKETQDDEEEITISYKPVDKRYYFLREETSLRNFWLMSSTLEVFQSVSGAPFASFAGLSFQDTMTNYYKPLQQLLTRSAIINAELMLTEYDVANFDFKKRYYIEQLGSNFIMNKINNYVPGKPVKCELIRIGSLPDELFTVQITRIVISIDCGMVSCWPL